VAGDADETADGIDEHGRAECTLTGEILGREGLPASPFLGHARRRSKFRTSLGAPT
jgi:hypothetical protein